MASPFERRNLLKKFASKPLPKKDCPTCLYKRINVDPGHCYMFRQDPPSRWCGQYRKEIR